MAGVTLTRSPQTGTTTSGRVTARGRSRRSEGLTKILFVLPAAVAMIALFGYPVVKNLLMSLQDYGLRTFFTGVAPWVGFKNYSTVVHDNLFSQAIANTAVFTVASIAFQFAIGLSLALFFRRRFPLGGLLRSLLLLPWLLPLIVSSATWRSILEQDSGILNRTLQGLHVINDPVPWLNSPSVALIAVIGVNIWIGIPFNVTLLYSGLSEIPDELYEAGQLDGATGWRAFWYITWPNLRSVASVVLMLGVVYTIKVLDIILGLTGGGPANATQTLATQSYQKSFVEFRFGQGAALSNILIAISFLFAIFYLRSTRRAVDE
ncbi:sugar ABC transporter permease [Kribbella sp. NPDC026611]|uniref:carbohydrate ABC transporter permease n=1 Tax=Kribbella sp. NPDC026611 TaxID=3154911 RepID=UPI00340E4E16